MALTTQTSGVRWSGMSDEPLFKASPEALAIAYEAHLKAKARQEAELAAYIASRTASAKAAA